ncbi:DUF1330 domain-containing protein [Cohnella sp. GbtcB17]|uniref:DUF1330 domain-containing protein n=1 Tax=Cohnella sp. GbtcB17 TaxID=2824762 RepID=UPI001C2F1EC4
MPAYVIFMKEKTTNIEQLSIYASKAPAGLAGHPLTPLAMYGKQEVLEGPEVEGVAVLEFPSIEHARAWYDSPAYQDALKHRLNGGTYRGIIVEGVAKE